MKQNRQQRAYEAPSLSTEEVRIEKAFLANDAASGSVQDTSEPGLNPGDDGDISDLFG